MAYHDDLLRQALYLVHKEPRNPKQASLRRGVSTAYYALFHLLIGEAVANWNVVSLRAALGRAFDHGIMKAASNRIQDTRQFSFTGEDPGVCCGIESRGQDFRSVAGKASHRRLRQHDILDENGGPRPSQIGRTSI